MKIQNLKLPNGFLAAGINCGVRRYRPDLGLIISECPASAVGVFTQNTCKAAPVKYCQNLLPSRNISAIVTNSGQANAATGASGELNNLTIAKTVAKQLNRSVNEVLTASTGVIGQQLEIEKITAGIPKLFTNLTTNPEKFALSILTTDLVPKSTSTVVNLSTGKVHITGICKGSGMIHPDMATMLGYILTDAILPVDKAQELLNQATNISFNMISVDGESSTNDSVFMLANGSSKISISTHSDYQKFSEALNNLCTEMAKSIVRDGEGATRMLDVKVSGCSTLSQAKNIARSITTSPLIKSAINGSSLNWGRIIARIGAEQVSSQLLEKSTIKFQSQPVFENGQSLTINGSILKDFINDSTINIEIDFNDGDFHATAWGCDLSEKYVKINAEYAT